MNPTYGKGAFVISAMNKIIEQCDTKEGLNNVKQHQLFGIELQQRLLIFTTEYEFTWRWKEQPRRDDLFHVNKEKIKGEGITKVLISPPYSQAKSKKLILFSRN